MRMRAEGGLGVFGQRQLIFRPFGHQLVEALAQCLVNFLKNFAGNRAGVGKCFAHADRLAALSRKEECPHLIVLHHAANFSGG